MPITPNALFHVDCIEMMQRVDDESIDLIYLDPPLPTQRFDWVTSAAKKLDTPISKQLHLISKVCQQGARILKQTGVFYLHTQAASTFSIRLILNQIFGEENFQDEIIWQYQQRPVLHKPGTQHDVILCYGKSSKSTNNAVLRPLNRDEIRRYSMADECGRYALLDLTAPVAKAGLSFEWHGITPPAGRSWRFNLETLQKLEQEGRIYFTSARPIPRLKSFLAESAGVSRGNNLDGRPQTLTKIKRNRQVFYSKALGFT
ncbi:MAG TPA: DNA methyltransferase [Candidatus Angelobacter sp.]|jgi:adenine specific DNA methylase Mod